MQLVVAKPVQVVVKVRKATGGLETVNSPVEGSRGSVRSCATTWKIPKWNPSGGMPLMESQSKSKTCSAPTVRSTASVMRTSRGIGSAGCVVYPNFHQGSPSTSWASPFKKNAGKETG